MEHPQGERRDPRRMFHDRRRGWAWGEPRRTAIAKARRADAAGDGFGALSLRTPNQGTALLPRGNLAFVDARALAEVGRFLQ